MYLELKYLQPTADGKKGLLKFSFWSMNIGLGLMILLSLLPVGLLRTWASVNQSYWYARSPEFMGTPLMTTRRWLRMPGDTLFAIGSNRVCAIHLRADAGIFTHAGRGLARESAG